MATTLDPQIPVNKPDASSPPTMVLRKATNQEAVSWLVKGVQGWLSGVTTWTAISLLNIVITVLLMVFSFIIPFLQQIALPFISAGLLKASHEQTLDNLKVDHLFAGISEQPKDLFIVGAVYAGGMMIIMLLSTILVLALAFATGLSLEQIQSDITQLILYAALFMLLIIGLTLPLVMALWFAPALIMFHQIKAIEAMTLSFKACLKNIVPYLVYSLVALIALLALGLLPVVGYWLMPTAGFVALSIIYTLLLMLILIPIFYISIYESYRDIFVTSETV
ncbi:BPSS1780 family membrane protein [Pleionea sp. CnH1-48]|uniref:BPSS1780 family membrane protein n=1 Tax=Pleionea sp. CnH1-48 TaxID=2954494 RepID=UPI0020983595|nr:BPSS1780 family membrane protein [Pleionea sp. CnH1-48]MCO7226794.1 hypothetical protein [Pleionea sp. CnH1-48]